MITKIWAVWALACTVGAARPGDLDRCFAPELRAWVVPDQVTLAVDGKAWIGGGFEQANGIPLGDLVKLGVDGGVENEPAPGYLGRRNAIRLGGIPVPTGRPFLLTDGGVWVLAGELDSWDSRGEPVPRRVFRVDATGNVVSQTLDILVPRSLELVAGPAGSFRLVYGLDQSRWGYWPKPEWDDYRIEWYSAAGVLSRTRNFRLPVFQPFAWAEVADGSWVATNGQTNIGGSSSFSTAKLRRYRPDGLEDPAFNSPGAVRSVRALAGGKWLVDGLRRLNANGSEDVDKPEWSEPQKPVREG